MIYSVKCLSPDENELQVESLKHCVLVPPSVPASVLTILTPYTCSIVN